MNSIPRQAISEEPTGLAPDEPHLGQPMSWLVHLRWVAIACVLITVIVCCHVIPIVEESGPLYLIAIVMILYNVCFHLRLSRLAGSPARTVERIAFLQLLLDIVCLTGLLHFAGSVENPFMLYFVFHMIIASILLPRKRSFCLAGVAVLCYSGMVLCEFTGVIGHHDLLTYPHLFDLAVLEENIWKSSQFLLGVLLAFATAIVGCVYFTTSIMERLRATTVDREGLQNQLVRQEKIVLLGEVAAGVAHEINNPLHGVQNCLSMIRAKPGQIPRAKELLELMEEGLDRIALITRRLLMFSRTEPLPKQAVDLNDVLSDSLAFVEHRAGEQNTSIERPFDGPLPTVWCDPKSISEVFINLLVNALDATARGRTITMQCGCSPSDPDRVEAAIRDSGCGIPPENMDKVFAPFFTTKPMGRGSGLGLSISRQIIEDHGGQITVESEVGRGTVFRITLPIYKESP